MSDEPTRPGGFLYDPLKWFKLGLVMIICITIVSTLYFWVIGQYYRQAHWTLLDCLFFVVITLSTIGYEDWLGVRGILPAKFYTIFLMIVGVGVHAFFISNVTALIVEGLFHDVFRRRRMNRQIQELQDHIIICGAGSVGVHCVEELARTKRPFVVIDRDEHRLAKVANEVGEFLYIVEEADDDDVLIEAGVKRATGLVTCLTDDKDNLFVTLSAHRLNPKLRIISKGIADNIADKLMAAGAERIVNPSAIGGLRMVSELIRPTVVTFIDTMLRDSNQNFRFEELTVEPDCEVADKSLAEADIRRVGDVLVVAARKSKEKSLVYNPKADFALQPGCTLVVLGRNEDLRELRPYFQKN